MTNECFALFLRAGLDAAVLRALLEAVDWQPIKERTAGNPSISKAELIEAYEARLASA